jgi:hypothetical protein
VGDIKTHFRAVKIGVLILAALKSESTASPVSPDSPGSPASPVSSASASSAVELAQLPDSGDLANSSAFPQNFENMPPKDKMQCIAEWLVFNFNKISLKLNRSENSIEARECLFAFKSLFDEIANRIFHMKETSDKTRIELRFIQNVIDLLVDTSEQEDLDTKTTKKFGELIKRMLRVFFNVDNDWKRDVARAIRLNGMSKNDCLFYLFTSALEEVIKELGHPLEGIQLFLEEDKVLKDVLLEKLKKIYDKLSENEMNNLEIWLKIQLAYKQLGYNFEQTNTNELQDAIGKAIPRINETLYLFNVASNSIQDTDREAFLEKLEKFYNTLSKDSLDDLARCVSKIGNFAGG